MQTITILEQLFKERKISRRQFISQVSALGLAAAISPALLAKSSHAGTLQPKKGGVLRMGVGHGSTTDTLDPATQSNAMTGALYLSLSNSLVEIGPNGDTVPEIAESWEHSKDIKTWRFKIRQGVEFHNGKTLDVNDVIASINHHRGEKTKSGAKKLFQPIQEIKADGKDTVVFTLKDANVDFPYLLADIHVTMLPAKDGGVDWKSGIGTGAYILDKFEPGVNVSMNRNPNYWKAGKGNFDRVEMITINDQSARINALKTGKIDIADRLDLKTIHLLGRIPGIKIEEVTSLGHYAIPMNTTAAPFNNNDVRMALKYGIDRESILKVLFKGHGRIGNDHPISPANKYFAKDLPQRRYDPDKAKFHLKKAGLSSLDVTLSSANAVFPECVDTSVLYKEHAAKAGININVERVPDDGYWSNIWMKKPMCYCYWRGRPTEDWMFTTAYSADAKYNDTFWKHGPFNKLLIAARAELDQKKRGDMYVEMQRIVRDEGGVIVPLYISYFLAVNKKLAHGPMLKYADLDGYKMPERWWFA